MRVIVRVNSSSAIGAGHLVRTLALVDRLRATATFVTRALHGNVDDRVRAAGHALCALPGDDADEQRYPWLGVSLEREIAESRAACATIGPADWLIVDVYALDAVFERALRPAAHRLFALDDLADRTHDVDALLDQNFVGEGDGAARYRGLVPAASRLFIGPSYAQLRPQFEQVKRHARRRDGTVHSVLVAFGSEPGDATLTALEALADQPLAVTVVLPAAAERFDDVRSAVAERAGATTLLPYVEDMAELLDRHDLVIGAGGTSAYERAYLGVPAIVWPIAENQRAVVDGLARAGAALALPSPPSVAAVRAALDGWCHDPAAVRAAGEAAVRVMRDRDRSIDALTAFFHRAVAAV